MKRINVELCALFCCVNHRIGRVQFKILFQNNLRFHIVVVEVKQYI
jgi:hypothetical protein